MERFTVKGKNAVATGAAGGLASEAVEALLDYGLDGVVLFDFNSEGLEAASKKFKEKFPDRNIHYQQLDVTDLKQVEESLKFATKVLKSIDIVLPFAGILPMAEDEVESWERIMKVNASGAFYFARVYGDYMADQETGGSIIFVASQAGRAPSHPLPIGYAASKAAVLALRMNMAKVYAPFGIRVNSISPGIFNSPMTKEFGGSPIETGWSESTPLGRFGETAEMSQTVLLLASEASGSYITGADMSIDGGFGMKI